MAHTLTAGGGTPLTNGVNRTGYARRRLPARVRESQSPTTSERFSYIAVLAQAKLPLREHESGLLIDDLPPVLVAGALSFQEDIRHKYEKTLALLRDAGVLTEREAATLAPRIDTQTVDHRTDKSMPLPKLG